MKRVCLVTETYRPEINGVSNTLGYWVDGMKANGLFMQIIRPKQSLNDENLISDNEEQITVKGLPIPGYAELKFGLPCQRRIRKLWQQNTPDALYVATEGPLGWSAVKVANAMGIPVLSGFHTNFQSYSKYYRLGILEPIILRYLRYFHNLTKGTIVPTLKQRDQLSSLGFNNVSVLSRGVDCHKFSPKHRSDALRSSWGADENSLVYIYVGRIAAEKNVAMLGDISKKIGESNQHARFVFVGDGPLMKTMRSKYPHINFVGMKTGRELAQHYASSDVFLFPSKTDTFGNVVTEAMASGLAIVSYDDAAAHEHLAHRVSGILAPLDSDQLFEQNALELASSPTLVNSLRETAYENAKSISWTTIVSELTHLLLDQESNTTKRKDYGHSENITLAP